MTKIELRNEDGKIVGYDPETGEKVPVRLEDFEANSCSVERVVNTPATATDWDDGQHPVVSTDHTKVYVDPANGSDANDGSQSNPLATLQEAAYRAPFINSHTYHIVLEPGTFTGNGRFMPFITSAKPNSDTAIQIRSSTGTPSDVDLQGVYSFGVWNGEVDKPLLQDVTLSGTLLGKFGSFKLDNVVISANNGLTTTEGTIGIDAHAPTTIMLDNCTFESATDVGVNLQEGARVDLRFCDGVCGAVVGKVKRGAEIREQTIGDLYGQEAWIKYEQGGRFITTDGHPKSGNVAVADDWGDGQLQNRYGPVSAGYRPEWDPQNGSPSATEGAATFPAGDTTAQIIRTPYTQFRENNGTWRYKFQAQTAPSAGDVFSRFYFQDGNNYWGFRLNADGTGDLLKEEGGTLSTDLVTLSWSADTSVVEVEVSRTNGGSWEVFVDGTSQGTLTDAFAPRPRRIDIQNRLDVSMHCTQFQMAPQ